MFDLSGTWITSFFSLVHDDPIDNADDAAAQLAGYAQSATGSAGHDHFTQVAGYIPAATLLCLRFKPDLKLVGDVKINRGGTQKFMDPDPAAGVGPVAGRYEAAVWNPDLHVYEGKFFTNYPIGPSASKQLEYRYVVRDTNALEWIWWDAISLPSGDPFRASVARGTLTRVLYTGP
jgi:hypothetical protein